jgi:GAF domain-containing protein/HAMP domain-containing protein
MSGEQVDTFGEQPSPQGKESAKQETSIRRRVASFRRLALVLVAGAVLTIGFYVVLYVNARVWQMLGEAGCLAVALACAAVGYWLAGRERVDAAGYLVLVGVFVAYGGNELVFAGATVYILVGGILLMVLAGSLVLPGRWPVWLAFVAVHLVYVLAVNQLEPVQRYDIAESMPMSVYIPGISAALVLGVLFQIARAYGRIDTIRVRLIVSSVLLVLLVAAAVGTGSIMVELYNARQQAFRQLESVASLKAKQIDSWITDLQLDVEAFFTEDYELTRLRAVLLWIELENPRDAQDTLRLGLQRRVDRAQRFEELFLVNLQGEVALSTYPEREGQNYAVEEFFERGEQGPYVQPPMYDTLTGQTGIYVCRPAIDTYGDTLGVLVARASLDRLNEICLERSGLGETGETYLVDASHTVVTELRHPSAGGTPVQIGDFVRSKGVDMALFSKGTSVGVYESYHGASVLGSYTWIPHLQATLLAEQGQQEVTAGARTTVIITGGIVLAAVLFAAVGAFFLSRGISEPLVELSGTATQIAAGDLSLVAETERQDEIGALARSFNSMTARLRELVGSLEGRVAEATRNLEAAAEVSRATTSVLDPESLQRQVVDMVQERFGLYYVGLFVLDERGEYAVLRAGTGEFGRVMLAQGHRLEVGGNSMIGQCVARNDQVVLQSAGDEVVRFENPLLPDTRSELALPMRARGRVIGAMTVQSDRESAFDEQYISALQTVADQVAVALDNARNFAEVEATLAQTQLVQQRYLGQAWSEYLSGQPVTGYEYAPGRGGVEQGMRPLGNELLAEVVRALNGRQAGEDDDLLVVPIVQGQRVVATLGFEKGDREWGDQDVALVQAVAEQLGLAAETQRLLEATQSRAAREQLTLRIAEQVRGALDIEEILRVASRSLGRELNASEVIVRLGTESTLLGEERS